MGLSDKTAQFLKKHKLDLEKRPADRGDAIHFAVLQNQNIIVDDLLSLYPKDCVNAKDRKGDRRGRLPLHNAAELGYSNIVTSLLAKAAVSGQHDIVSLLIEQGADVNAQTNKGVSALHAAAELRSPETILKLLLHGADVNLVTQLGTSPLHFAVESRCAPATALLLFHGASPKLTNKKGVSPRDLLSQLPKEDRPKFEHIFKCATDKTSLQALVSKQLNPDTPLDMAAVIHWAVEQNLDRAIAYLLHVDQYAVEARSQRGWHPLHQAARSGFPQCARVLLEHGAEVDCITKTGWTPLMLAAEQGHKDTIKVLLDHNANRTLVNDSRVTASQIAKRSGHQAVALALAMRYVPPSAAGGDEREANGKDTLSPPRELPIRRTPSPRPRGRREVEGELYALTDATSSDSSTSSPLNSKYMEEFLSTLEKTWYDKVQWSAEDDDTSSGGRDWTGPVKIAILDTGIDLEHEDFLKPARRRTKIGLKAAKRIPEKTQRERIKACRNFVGDSTEDVTDETGHGTHIAGLILSIAPRAELYIAKTSSGQEALEKHEVENSASKKGRRESRRPIENALRWAIDQNVHIINLSLGFPRESSYELNKALEDANYKGIIVFAAAANHGNRQAIAWPARDPDLAICVTSGDEFSKVSRFAPSSNGELPMFLTYGEDVYSHWPTQLGGEFRKMSGTSVSTPIAVSMAAMILAFLNRTNAWSPEQKRQRLDRSKEGRLRSTRGMGRLLEHICRDRDGVKVLSPLLMWDDDQDLEPLEVLRKLAQPFRLIA